MGVKVHKPRQTARAVNTRAAGVRTASATMTVETRQKLVYADRRWRRLRKIVLAQHPECVGCSAKAKVLDHIMPIQQPDRLGGGLSHAFDCRNVQPLCREHHDQKTDTIDAPRNNPLRYRYDLSSRADMRPQSLKDWATWFFDTGEQLRQVGDPKAGEDTEKGKQWVGDIYC
jgi:5-methylcytosine-specific restriction endonuclease McrA